MKGSGFWTVLRKELARFFGDRRMALTTILLPGVMIFVMYTFMGTALANQFSVDEDFAPTVQAVNLPDSVAALGGAAGLTFQPAADQDQAKALIAEKKLHALMVFPEEFDAQVAAYVPGSGPAPAVGIYYNSAEPNSAAVHQMLTALLDGYESALSNKFDVNPGEEGYDLATQSEALGSFMASMLPMLLMLFLFTGCMSVAPESIAGEKERGTIATLLVTPLSRAHLALGKICALSVIALLSGLSSTVGTLLSMPKLMQMDGGMEVAYSGADYLALAVVILASVLLIVAVISIISAFAKSIKEAQGYVTPLMILVMLVGISAMFGGGAQTNPALYLVPFYNSVQAMVGIFSFHLDPVNLAVTVASNLAYTGVGVFVLTRMFNSENVMFSA